MIRKLGLKGRVRWLVVLGGGLAALGLVVWAGLLRAGEELARRRAQVAALSPIEKDDLVGGHAQQGHDAGIEPIERALEVRGQERVEVPAPTQHAQDDLGGERGISGRQALALDLDVEGEVRERLASLDALEDAGGNPTGG